MQLDNNYSFQQDNKSESLEDFVFCPQCQKQIQIAKFDIHQARCKKFCQQQQTRQVKQNKKKHFESYYDNGKQKKTALSTYDKKATMAKQYKKNPQQKLFDQKVKLAKGKSYGDHHLHQQLKPQKKQFNGKPAFLQQKFQKQQEQKIECEFCGRLQPLFLLQTHELQCKKLTKCKFCLTYFPKQYMLDHFQVCLKNTKRNSLFDTYKIDKYKRFQKQFEYPREFQSFQDRYNDLLRLRENYDNQNQQDWRTNQKNLSKQERKMIAELQIKSKNQKKGLTKRQINHLHTTSYHKKPSQSQQVTQTAQNSEICPICYLQFYELQPVLQLLCRHVFHEECVKKWLQMNATCPTCKTPL